MHFTFDDMECLHGCARAHRGALCAGPDPHRGPAAVAGRAWRRTNPYQSSKYAEEMLSHAVQLTYGDSKHITSINTTPGTVLTGLSLPIIPDWAWLLVVPLLALVRARAGRLARPAP